MSKYLYILDAGHGGIDPISGKYVTSGKRSPKFDDGFVLYEGVENRRKVKAIAKLMEEKGLDYHILVDTWEDVKLSHRVNEANKLAKKRKCVYISIHSDAFGNGQEWTSPSGISVFTSKGQTKSDEFAQLIIQELKCNFENDVKWRLDHSDGDSDKEADFYVLRKTSCPAVLLELGFHTNKEEAQKMLTNEWVDKVAKSVVDACLIWE